MEIQGWIGVPQGSIYLRRGNLFTASVAEPRDFHTLPLFSSRPQVLARDVVRPRRGELVLKSVVIPLRHPFKSTDLSFIQSIVSFQSITLFKKSSTIPITLALLFIMQKLQWPTHWNIPSSPSSCKALNSSQTVICDFGLYGNASSLSDEQKLAPNDEVTGKTVRQRFPNLHLWHPLTG